MLRSVVRWSIWGKLVCGIVLVGGVLGGVISAMRRVVRWGDLRRRRLRRGTDGLGRCEWCLPACQDFIILRTVST